MNNNEYQRWREPKMCFIPTCPHNDVKNLEKRFFAIRKELKENWCDMADRNCPKRRLYCCEDHINFEEDIENYEKWISGAKPRLKLNATLKNIPVKAMKPSSSNIRDIGTAFTSNVANVGDTFVIQTARSMPLTQAEKSRRYREKLKRCDPEKFMIMKEKALERAKKAYRKKFAEMADEQKEELRAKWKAQNNIDKQKNNLHIQQLQQVTRTSQKQNDIHLQESSCNRTNKRNMQPRQSNRKNDNIKLRKDMQNLKKRFNSLQKQMQIQQQELVKINQNYESVLKKFEETPRNVIKIKTSVELVKEDPILCMESTIKEEEFVDELNIETLKTEEAVFEHNVLTEETVIS